jgi:UDP-2-acetamido-2,6-beta-L-arabino-hexul-4-ose reductase
MSSLKSILITGAHGFIGKNLAVQLHELGEFDIVLAGSSNTSAELAAMVATSDFIIHLAGVNRPQDDSEFLTGNVGPADSLAAAISACDRAIPIIYTSSAKAIEDTPYGLSKLKAEDRLKLLSAENGSPVAIFRLPNVFGKWCRPNYNSAVATFCFNIANGQAIAIKDPSAPLTLVYIDDVIRSFVDLIHAPKFSSGTFDVTTIYTTTVGAVAEAIQGFRDNRLGGVIDDVGTGFTRALYATYVSYLPVGAFSYPLVSHCDHRGAFSEMLKTKQSGQFSYFTAKPGVTRGGHYHHTKTEKFLIVSGKAHFRFRHILTNETHEIITSDETPQVVETIPGWAHDVTNIGNETMVSMLWANEIFDRDRPDTIAEPV